jgi:hypothetical protein
MKWAELYPIVSGVWPTTAEDTTTSAAEARQATLKAAEPIAAVKYPAMRKEAGMQGETDLNRTNKLFLARVLKIGGGPGIASA